MIGQPVTIAIEKGIIKSKSIIVDATHTLSQSNPFSTMKILRERSKLLRKTVYQFDEEFKTKMPSKNLENDLNKELDYCKKLEKIIENAPSINEIPSVKEKLNLLKEMVEDTDEQLIFSKDRDAKTGHKSATFIFWLQNASGDERRADHYGSGGDFGEKGNIRNYKKLLQMSQDNGMECNAVVGNAAYSGKENLKIASEQNIKIVARLNPSITQGFRKDEDKFDYNRECRPICLPSRTSGDREGDGKKNIGENQVDTYYFDVEKCKVCPLKEGCYKDGAKSKTYSVSSNRKYIRIRWFFRKAIITKKNQNTAIKSKPKTVN